MAQLELSTTREREFVTIDGVNYTLRAWDDLEFEDLHSARKLINQLTPDGQDKMKEGQVKQVAPRIQTLLKWIIPDLPEEVLGKLNFGKRTAIVIESAKGSGDFLPKTEGKKETETKV